MNAPEVLDETTARELVAYIRSGLDELRDTILRLWAGQGWLVLGYPTWVEMCAAEFPFRLSLPREERRELVAELSEEGMSQPAIAGAIGVSQKTVSNDIREVSSFTNLPDRTTGLDGKEYRRPEPKPQPVTSLAEEKPRDPFADWTADELALRQRIEGGQTVVVNLRAGVHTNLIEWADTTGRYVRIDRRTEWGNPFEIPDDGDRRVVIAKYAQHYLPHKTALLARVHGLRGKALGCWCAPEPCHGDVLKAAVER